MLTVFCCLLLYLRPVAQNTSAFAFQIRTLLVLFQICELGLSLIQKIRNPEIKVGVPIIDFLLNQQFRIDLILSGIFLAPLPFWDCWIGGNVAISFVH